ncbi:hypothetical protein So717_42720 [Roseobacter cerasinus]|uniref:Uncharacterized protein n=1 Tax=Roseobacter cerasinus TaxID=2602289 RepID=A0A640VWX0_9RHOB|nr:hypothetical protein So717_42720 [Roseobacter cerasinus]
MGRQHGIDRIIHRIEDSLPALVVILFLQPGIPRNGQTIAALGDRPFEQGRTVTIHHKAAVALEYQGAFKPIRNGARKRLCANVPTDMLVDCTFGQTQTTQRAWHCLARVFAQ